MSATGADAETTTFEELQETYEYFYVPQFSVTVGERTFTEADGLLSDLSVDLSLDAATAFSFTLNYPYDRERGRFRDFEWEAFEPGREVSVSMGYGGTTPPVLQGGRIQTVQPRFPADSAPTIAVSGFGPLHALTSVPESGPSEKSLTRTWEDTPPHEVVEAVVSERGYDFDGVETVDAGVSPPQIKQDESSHDLAFLLRLGEEYAYELFARDRTLYFRRSRYDGPPDVVLRYGVSLDSFAPQLDDSGQVDAVEVRSWDATRGEEIVGTATRADLGVAGGDGAETTETLRLPVADEAAARARAEAVLANRLDGTVTGQGECVGLPEIRPGTRLRLERLTDRFSAVYYVESATHRFGSSGYRTSFSVKRREL
ncbi:MAG: phage late control D family protein [Haloferacaceae archaeon]